MQPATDGLATPLLPARLPKGFECGGYIIDGWLRDGGMAAIYRARRAGDEARVALKLQLLSTARDSELREHFEREANALRLVADSPYVVNLFDTGQLADGRYYLAIEWIDGENLEELLDFLRNQDQRMDLARACRLGHEIAAGLAVLHQRGLVHLDLKPANIMVGPGPDDTQAITLVDFGIVGRLDETTSNGLAETPEDPVMGTSAYMAPEQLSNERPSVGMDLFALGVVLYEAITGRSVPPDGWTPESLPSMESLRRSVPPELAELVRACMSSDPSGRPASAVAVAGQLRILAETVAPSPSVVAPLPCAPSRAPAPAQSGGTAVTPLAQLPAYTTTPVQTGETEVALTHEQVRAIATGDDGPPAPAEPRAPALAAATPEEARSSSHSGPREDSRPVPHAPPHASLAAIPSLADHEKPQPVPHASLAAIPSLADHEDSPPVPHAPPHASLAAIPSLADHEEPRRAVWPWAALLLVPLLLGGMWLVLRGGDAEDRGHEPLSGEPSEVTRAGHAELPEEQPPRTDEPHRELDRDSAPPPARPADAPAASPPIEAAVEQPSREPTPTKRHKPRGPSAEQCEQMRAEAKAAGGSRDWRTVLAATRKAACWSSAKLERRRLRVKAFLETGDYKRCVKIGGSSRDVQIVNGVKLCRKKLAEKG